ncbi:MAG: quinol:cytochrome C oxidoreductase [Planctomycetota bacterium]
MALDGVNITGDRRRLEGLASRGVGGGLLIAAIGIVASLMLLVLAGEDPAPAPGHEAGGGAHAAGGTGVQDPGAAHGGAAAPHASGHVTTWSPYHSYLVSACFYLTIGLGALFFVIIHHLTRAGWSTALRRIAEAVSLNLALMALLFLPVILPGGVGRLYKWAHPDPGDALIAVKGAWLSSGWFAARILLYFAIWIAFSLFYHRQSVRQDESGDMEITRRMARLSPIACILFAFSVTFASFDLLLSLDAHWFSTIFGVYFFAGCVVSFHSFLALIAFWLQQNGRLESSITSAHYHDVGKMIFAFIVFWTYIAFSQYMLIWYANLPEETGWYLRRQGTEGWTAASFVLLFGHFLLPFLLLLSRHVKRRKGALAVAAVWVLLIHWFDIYYLVMPQVSAGGFRLRIIDAALFIAMGGLFLAATAWNLRGSALIPERDPRLPESLAFENV